MWRAPAHVGVAVVLCVVAGVVRAGPLGPSSLWLDDAWVALVSKTSGVSDTFMVGLTGPGFAFLLKGWLAVVGFSETAAQLPAFFFGVVGPGLLYLVAVARGFSFAGALTAGGLLAASPVHVVYSTRVKHYTLDVVLAIVLIALAWRVVESPSSVRRWVWLAVGASAAVALSGGVAPMAAGAMGVALVASLRSRVGVAVAVTACGAWAAFALGWYLLVLRPAITPAIRGYWAERYVASVADLVAGFAGLLDGFSALPLVVVGIAVAAGMAAVGVHRPLVALLLVAPVIGLVVLSAAGVAPLGGGRTDAFVYPSLALLVAGGVNAISRTAPAAAWVGATVVLAASIGTTGWAPPYPAEDVRPLVALVEQQRRTGEPLLVYPSTVWAYALYADDAVRLVRSDNPWGFVPQVNDADVVLLEAHRDAPQLYAPAVAAAARGKATVWLLSSHHRSDVQAIRDAVRASGLRLAQRWQQPDAALWSWNRR